MPYRGPVRRWDIFWAYLNPVVGREQAGSRRPVLVVSSDAFSRSTMRLVMAVPLTSREGKVRRFQSFEVPLPADSIETGITSMALTQQLRALSTDRLLAYAGHLDNASVQERIEDILLVHLGIDVE